MNLNENDYKYVLKETATTEIGARYTYEEALFHEFIPFKFQSIIQIYLLKEVTPDVVIGEHFLSITEGSLSYRIFNQLKIKIQFCEPKPNGTFKVKSMHFAKFQKYKESNWTSEHFLTSFTISNLALMGFQV